MKVRICPTFDPYHNSSLLQAILELFGPANVRYTCEGFPRLDARSLSFVVEPLELKICLDHIDIPRTIVPGLEWCDVYGKSNVDPTKVPAAHASKLLITGPCFPFRLCGPVQGLLTAARTYGLCLGDRKRIKSVREHFANWWRQYKYRLWQSDYLPEPCTPGYVFFSATIWKTEPECNQFRANFMEVCRTLPGLQFEGGFMPRPNNDVPGFERYTTDHKRSHGEYVSKTKRSTVAFNTPSVFGCNPWRLAEFMGMSKALIQTPLVRDLPAPLTHGENVHFVDGSLASIREAVELIFKDADYREHLGRGARAYYLAYLDPRRIIQRVLAFGAQRKNLDRSSLPLGDESITTPALESVALSGR